MNTKKGRYLLGIWFENEKQTYELREAVMSNEKEKVMEILTELIQDGFF